MRSVPLPFDVAIDAPRVGHVPTTWDSGPPVSTARFGTWVFLASEAFFFGGLLAAYFVLRASSPSWVEPLGVGLGVVLSILLVGSSLCAGLAVRAIRREKRPVASTWLLGGAFLALAFVLVQAYEWNELAKLDFTLRTSLAGSCFYVLTAAHGLHVLVGAAWMFGSGLAIRRDGSRTLHAELAALYQHFVDGVWLVLFVILYLV